ncbi:MAG: gliding motility-associated C-terminal domain-containing protein [Salibacteraceae bacterium]
MVGLVLLFGFYSNNVFGQKEANNWYFGNKAAFHFNTTNGSPVAISGSAMNTLEGCSSISDKLTGALLFYTDGQNVYNSNHALMPNGMGLNGNNSSSHSSVVVPYPGNSNKHYIFTVPSNFLATVTGAEYSVVDMTLQSGLGDVVSTQKNVSLVHSPTNLTLVDVADRCASIAHANGQDYWVIVQNRLTWSFYAYLVTATGVSNAPVISTMVPVGLVGNVPHYGCMKISPDGKKMASVYRTEFVLFDFNNQTGVLTNQTNVNHGGFSAYGVEFSPNSKLLYVNPGGIHQYDPHLATAPLIAASKVSLLSGSGQPLTGNGQLQLAPDFKIYWAKSSFSTNVISRIDSPDVAGLGCAFRDTGVVLTSGAISRLGLPTFVQSFLIKTSFSVENACENEYVNIAVNDTGAVDSVFFNYGDPGSSSNTTWNKLDSHIFSGPGKYEVTAHLYYTDLLGKVEIDTIRDTVEVLQIPIVQLPNDTTICISDTISAFVLNDSLASPFSNYWQDSSQTSFQVIDSAGLYFVSAVNACGSSIDTIVIDSLFKREAHIGNDTLICNGDSLLLDLSDTASVYLWSTGVVSSSISVTSTGKYWGQSTNMCGIYSDTIDVVVIDPPKTDIGNDTAFCNQSLLYIGEAAASKYSTYVWNGNSARNAYRIICSQTGNYTLVESNVCGVDSATIFVQKEYKLQPFFGPDTLFCRGDVVTLNPFSNGSKGVWNTGSTNNKISISKAGSYWFKVKNSCGTYVDTIKLGWIEIPNNDDLHDTVICLGDSVLLQTNFPNSTYLWNTGANGTQLWVKNPGKYWVRTTTICGSNLDSMELFVDENIIIDPINDSIICDSDIFEAEVTGQFIRKYLWNTGNTDSKQIINKSGIYRVSVENACGVDSMSFLIEHFETPLPKIGSDTVICLGDEIYLKTNLPDHVLNSSEVLWNDQFSSDVLDVVEASWYKVSVKNKCGEGRDSIKVDVKPLPSLNFSEENIVCDNYLKFDFSRLGYRLLWQDGSEKLKYKISESGEYSVEITDELGCFNYEEFTVKECPGKLWVPNAFTPNYDATNEGFRAYKDGAFYFNLEIYDRWGKLVFTSEDITESWDGTYNNDGVRNCTAGTYVWKIKIKEYENTDLQIFTGEVALIY